MQEVNLLMPPFSIRSKIEGKNLFKDMHVEELFTAEAQLDKITDQKPVGKQIPINEKNTQSNFVRCSEYHP